MARVDPALIDALLLGQGDRRRQLQDFPILGDVWAQFGSDPNGIHELLLTPHREASAPRLANFLEEETRAEERSLSYVHGLVAAQTTLDDLALVILPSTSWWHKTFGEREGLLRSDESGDAVVRAIASHFTQEVNHAAQGALRTPASERGEQDSLDQLPNVDRQAVRLGMLLGLLRAAGNESSDQLIDTFEVAAEQLGIESVAKHGGEYLVRGWAAYRRYWAQSMGQAKSVALVWQVALNRAVEFALERSVPAIKADAAAQLFSISCSSQSWAILDSGIDANHPAFADRRSVSGSRVRATYDFGRIGDILNKANRFNAVKRRRVANEIAQKVALEPDDVEERLLTLAEAMGREQPISWTLVEPLIKRDNPDPPIHPHGTHVAGILGADWREREGDRETTRLRGVCPDINLYDFRVLGGDSEQSEFSIIAALQFIRYLNARSGFMLIDGVNMSLSIPHSVRNYACGYTPICVEAEKLVANGVVVVAAAGNRGYQQFQLADKSTFESYAASSITDPGNAEGVITVGATHRNWPHTYGVSFFSSRGPTGDGRLKPDLLAPGERIDSCVPGPAIDTMDGTSMAAPHVSGAAALLIARHQELKGRPARVKQILCETATDLGRERHFQGHGMIDVLRAIQSL